MFLFRTETKRVGGSALRRQEYGEYPGEKSQVFQERRQKSDQSSQGIWQRARSGRVCSAVELSDLRREHLKSRQNVSFLQSDQGASNGVIHGASEFTNHRRSVEREDADGALANVSRVECCVSSRYNYRLLLFIAEGGKYPLRAQYILAETTRWVSL